MHKGESILFVCTHGIGDLLMTIPTIRVLAKKGYRISLLVKGRAECDVANFVIRDVIESCCALTDFHGNYFVKVMRVLRWMRKHNFSYAFSQFGVSSRHFSILSLLGGAGHRVGWAGPLSFINNESFEPEGLHKVIETARFIEYLGFSYNSNDLLPNFDVEVGQPENVVAFAPGSGEVESHKRWPESKYVTLARRLVEELDVNVEVLGGPGEESLCEKISAQANSIRVKSFGGKLSISETFDRLKKSNVVVANCNGLSHMAAAVGAPVVGLYGPTDAEHTGPYTTRLTCVSQNLECSPCYRRGFITGCGNPVCMRSIEVDTVFSAVRNYL